MKKKYLLMGVAGALVLSTMIGGTLAALDTETKVGATADISVKSIGVSLDKGNGASTEDGTLDIEPAVVPGGDYECSYSVSNNEENGYDIYVKVTIYKYWESDDATLTSEYDSIYFDGNKTVYPLGLEEDETFRVMDNGWLLQYADEEQLVLYYTKPLAPGESSTDFMKGIHFDTEIGNAYADKTLVLEYEVTAVQRNNGEDAMAAEWGMFPEFDEDGNLTGVYETEAERHGN